MTVSVSCSFTDLRICSRTNLRSDSPSLPARHRAPPATRIGSKCTTPSRLISFWNASSKRLSKHQTIAASHLYLSRGESKWKILRMRAPRSLAIIVGRTRAGGKNQVKINLRTVSQSERWIARAIGEGKAVTAEPSNKRACVLSDVSKVIIQQLKNPLSPYTSFSSTGEHMNRSPRWPQLLAVLVLCLVSSAP